MKIAFVFPGQGSQKVGMGQDLLNEFPKVKELYNQADSALGRALSELCFTGPEEELLKTANTQPAILATSVACYQALVNHGIEPEGVAGHSLGEYSALVAAGVLSFEAALKIVEQRGLFMQAAVPPGSGMVAILGLATDKVEAVCEEAKGLGVVEVANYNCPGQIVIAGVDAALDKAMELGKAQGAKRAVRLAVAGPFHSSLMKGASDNLAPVLEQFDFAEPQVPVYLNVTAQKATNAQVAKELLLKQVYSSVRWEEIILNMIADGFDTFVEVGPGKVLSGLIKKINKEVLILNVEDMESLQNTLAKLKEVS